MGRKTHKDPALIKKELVERLAQGYGIAEACKIIHVSRGTYYNWKRKDAAFGLEVDRILADPIHSTRILRGASKAELGIEDDWKLRFLGEYRRSGDRNQALITVGEGKRAQEIEAAMDPQHKEYDKEFHEAFVNEEQKRLWQIEDNTLRKAEHDMPTARFVLGNLVKEKYGKLEGSTTINQSWFNAKGESEASDALEEMGFGKTKAEHEGPADSGPSKVPEDTGQPN